MAGRRQGTLGVVLHPGLLTGSDPRRGAEDPRFYFRQYSEGADHQRASFGGNQVNESSAASRALAVLAVCFVMNVLARGISETWVVFLLPVGAEFQWSRSQLAGVYSVFMVVHGLAAPLAGLIFDRFGPRVSYVCGLVSLGSGYFLAGRLDALWQFYLCVGVFGGVGVALLGMVTASALISRWFRARIGTAMGVAYAGLGFGVIAIVPFTQWLIESVGWRSAYSALGAGLFLVLPVVAGLPWRRFSRGHSDFIQSTSEPTDDGWSLSRAARDSAFWGLVAAFFFTGASIFATTIQLVAYFVDIGFGALYAATAFGFMGMLSTAGVTASGWMVDRYGRRRTATISYCLTLTGFGLLFLLAIWPGTLLLALFVGSFGVSAGSRGPVVATLASELFPGGGLGAIYGVITLGMGLGAGMGSWISGVLYDISNGYYACFAFGAVMAAFGLAQFWLIPALAFGRRDNA